MQCPHCRHEEADTAAECSKCGFALEKWRLRQQQAAAGQPAPLNQPLVTVKKASGVDLSIWILLLVATIAVWKLTRSGQESAAVAGSAGAVAAASAEAGTPIPDESWRFEGKVTDLLRGNPIKGAKVSFLDWETGRQSEAVSDEDGHFAVDVDIRWKRGYAAEISHPQYRSRIWSGLALKADRQSRLRMGLEPAPAGEESPSYRGTRKKEPVTLDFALFPQDLSDSERAEAGQ